MDLISYRVFTCFVLRLLPGVEQAAFSLVAGGLLAGVVPVEVVAGRVLAGKEAAAGVALDRLRGCCCCLTSISGFGGCID